MQRTFTLSSNDEQLCMINLMDFIIIILIITQMMISDSLIAQHLANTEEKLIYVVNKMVRKLPELWDQNPGYIASVFQWSLQILFLQYS